MLCIVLPNRAISLTTDNINIKSPATEPIVFLEPDIGETDRLYKEWLVQNQIKKIKGSCSCVTFVKKLTGYTKAVGPARKWPINSTVPVIEGVVVLNESRVGHVAYITSVKEDSFTISESNYLPCQKGQRVISNDNNDIIGFWKPPV